MGWITQEYEDEVHVVPDTEPGHVLSSECFCVPFLKQDRGVPVQGLWIHNDKADRILNGT